MRILDKSLLVVSLCSVAVVGASSLPWQSARAQSATGGAQQAALPAYCAGASDHTLPLPTSLSPDAFHDRLLAFLQNTEYVKSELVRRQGRARHRALRQCTYLGHHPAVRIYYSPAVMKWLVNGREGDIPDGAMIVKEMYRPARREMGRPAAHARFVDGDDQGCERVEGRLVLGRAVDQHSADAQTERQLQAALQRAQRRIRAVMSALPRLGGERK